MKMKQKVKEPVNILCESYTIREQKNEQGIVEAVFLEGVAITFGKPTRNRVSYTYESGIGAHATLVGKPFLDTHNDSSIRTHPPFGHVEATSPGTNPINKMPCLNYRVNVDPEETVFIRKAKRKDIPGVSIQVLVDDVVEKQDTMGTYIEANIREYLELSAVLIPGDGDSTLAFAEKFIRFKDDLNTASGEGVISPDGIFPKKKVLSREQDDGQDDEIRPLAPFDKPMSKQSLPTEQKQFDPKYDKDKDIDDIDLDKPKRYIGSRETTVASEGLKCPRCTTQFLKDSFNNVIQLRCYKCNYKIKQSNRKFKRYAVEAYQRLINK